ncbi:MAG TPA: tetratricopeptide repeat protein [Gemmatimonadales bacterium]|jgi:tetratricopeptide (TPR) repeat protein|nr:tetratricopeptide repeat protein [Gemmatimonadales bacterium]
MNPTLDAPKPRTGQAQPHAAPLEASGRSWLEVLQSKLARWIALGVLGLVLATWFGLMSSRRKEAFAARALDQARNAAESGNLPLAASELQKVISTYAGTDAAQEAVIALNQVRLINGQHELAAVSLEEFVKSGPKPAYRSAAYGLLGRAYENANRPADAARAFENASRTADTDYLRADFLIDAGRAWANAGDTARAIEAYRRILKDYPRSSSKVEAEVRLAELNGGKL